MEHIVKAIEKHRALILEAERYIWAHPETGYKEFETSKYMENAFEALVGAIFLDGGYKEAERFVLPFISDKVDSALSAGETRDYKTILQQIVQQGHGDHLEYILVSQSGPDHDKTYEMEARLNRNVIGRGTGHSKKQAEQSAAADALNWFGNPSPNGKA